MPKSSHPAIVIINALLLPMGFVTLLGGIVGAAAGGEIWWVFALLAGSGALMLYGGIRNIVEWRKAVQAEDETTRAMVAAVQARPDASTALPGPVLAHWTYGPAEWHDYALSEMRFRTREALGMAATVIVLGTLLLGVLEGEWGVALGVSLVVGGAIGLGRWGMARAAHRGNLSVARGDVIVGPGAVLVNGRYQTLHDGRIRFGGARVLEGEHPAILEITVKVPGRYRHIPEEYRIPIPAGKEEEARAVAEALQRAHHPALAGAAAGPPLPGG